jgi:hypothetical protein
VHGCTKHTIGSEISLAARFAPNVPRGTPVCDAGQVEDHFNLVGYSVNLGEIGARFGPNVWPCKSFWAYAMELLGNVG